MDSQAFIKDLMQKLMAIDGTKLDDFEGCNDEEIQLLMKAQNVDKLPEIYTEFMKAMGKSSKQRGWKYLVGEDLQYLDALELKDIFAEELQYEEVQWQIPDKAFVFWTHHGYVFYYFLTDEGDDPRVFEYVFAKEQKDPRAFAQHFSEMMDWEVKRHEYFVNKYGKR